MFSNTWSTSLPLVLPQITPLYHKIPPQLPKWRFCPKYIGNPLKLCLAQQTQNGSPSELPYRSAWFLNQETVLFVRRPLIKKNQKRLGSSGGDALCSTGPQNGPKKVATGSQDYK